MFVFLLITLKALCNKVLKYEGQYGACHYFLYFTNNNKFMESTYGECGSSFSKGNYYVTNDTFFCSYKSYYINKYNKKVRINYKMRLIRSNDSTLIYKIANVEIKYHLVNNFKIE